MKNRTGQLCAAVFLLAAGVCGAGSLVIDHRQTDITQRTQAQIERAKSVLHIAYGHTSHGSQLTDGMSGLVGFANGGGKGLALPDDIFAWNHGGSDGALDLEEGAGYESGWLELDCGYWQTWYDETREYLDDPSHSEVNVIIWSWCGEMSGKYSGGTLSNEYLLPMAELEQRYPGVVFVYMTGHVDILDDANNKAACEAIRNWCSVSNRVLYDFNDIEHHDPDGTSFEFVDDYCSIYDGAGGNVTGNWASEWQDAHTQNADWYDCGSAHSLPLNANQKAYAAWALWCKLAVDLDRDGLADEWEERHGGTHLFGSGTNNYDGDAMTDWEEYVLDFAPTNAGARFAIGGQSPTNAATVEFPSSADRVYSLRACDDLALGAWISITSRPGTGAAMRLTDDDPLTDFRAYGVGVSLPE